MTDQNNSSNSYAPAHLNVDIRSTILPLNRLGVSFFLEGDAVQKSEDLITGKDFKSYKALDKAIRVTMPNGMVLTVSDRFWKSFANIYALGRSVFTYWAFNEVFERVTKQRNGKPVRLTYEKFPERKSGVDGVLLSCTNPEKSVLTINDVNQIFDKYNAKEVGYTNGQINATFACPFPATYKIGGDAMSTQYMLAAPVDGYGLPASYLALLRLVCSNGMIGMSKAFKTVFQLGGDGDTVFNVLDRSMEAFNNEEGFHAFKDRLEAATSSWASLHNYLALDKTINKAATADSWPAAKRADIADKLTKLAGNPLMLYGITGVSEPNPRLARTVPVKASVYDLLNFATEVATHHTNVLRAKNALNAWVGELISTDFDLENTITNCPDFQDMFLNDL